MQIKNKFGLYLKIAYFCVMNYELEIVNADLGKSDRIKGSNETVVVLVDFILTNFKAITYRIDRGSYYITYDNGYCNWQNGSAGTTYLGVEKLMNLILYDRFLKSIESINTIYFSAILGGDKITQLKLFYMELM